MLGVRDSSRRFGAAASGANAQHLWRALMARLKGRALSGRGSRDGRLRIWFGCRRRRGACIVGLMLVSGAAVWAASGPELTVEELKAKLSATSIGDRPHLCLQIAERRLTETDTDYAAADYEKGQTALIDVVAFTELARDYSLQSHKHQKQTEIAVRGMTRKLTDLMHSLPHDDQTAVRDAITRLQRVRDDLLLAMFPKGGK